MTASPSPTPRAPASPTAGRFAGLRPAPPQGRAPNGPTASASGSSPRVTTAFMVLTAANGAITT